VTEGRRPSEKGVLLPHQEFTFVVSDVKLTKAQQAKVSEAVAQAGALALADFTPPNAVSVQIGTNRWWRGIPAPDLYRQLQQFAQKSAGG
jgi:hypothetical protein